MGCSFLLCFAHSDFLFCFSSPLQAPLTLLRLGERFWVVAAGVIGGGRTPSYPARVCKFSGLPAALAAAAASWGRAGGTEQGLFSLAQLHWGSLRLPGTRHGSSSPDGGWDPGGCYCLLLCCPKKA